jgi:predicted transcriptional regulator
VIIVGWRVEMGEIMAKRRSTAHAGNMISVCVMVPHELVTRLDAMSETPRGRSRVIRRLLAETAHLGGRRLHRRAETGHDRTCGVSYPGAWRRSGSTYLSFTVPAETYADLKRAAERTATDRSVHLRGRMWAGVAMADWTGAADAAPLATATE